jgi:lantibiotic modifying enzyme
VLYDPARFDSLTETPWDEARVSAGIREIVADADAAFDVEDLWPAYDWDAWQTPTPLLTLYVGAAGVTWALDMLRRRGLAETRLDLRAAAHAVVDAWRREPSLMRGIELPEPARAAFLNGLSGILAVANHVDPSAELADELYALVTENVSNTATGVMWGSPGTMLAARAVFDATGDERWADVWHESASRLLEARDEDGSWEQRLYGETFHGLGPMYGLVGNVLALLGGGEWLGDTRFTDQAAAILRDNAVLEDGLVNWPRSAGGLLAEEGEVKLQWCSGAPGIVVCAGSYLDEELLLAGAATIWGAGAHGAEKGSSICHGTAGNGYALLAAFERTGDEVWLERARRFAMHALEQAAAARAERGRGRYSLWTGDVGVAHFAADCLRAETRYPVLATWD